jgi:hypothetical protein
MRLGVLALPLCVLGCGDDTPVLEGPHHQYVVSDIQIAANSAEARASALDLDGDDVPDNQFGMVFGLLAGQGLSVAGTARDAILTGGMLMLADLQAPTLVAAELAGFTTFLGADPDPAPCRDPLDLATCGQHLKGGARFAVDPGSASALGTGAIDDRELTASLGTLPVELVIDRNTLRLDLQHARVRLTGITAERIDALFVGGIRVPDLDGIVVPEARAQIDRIITTECNQPEGIPPCGCLDDSRSDRLQSGFDDNDDCTVTLPEVAGNRLVNSLLTPDLEIGGERLMSFGVGVTLVPAEFDVAVP